MTLPVRRAVIRPSFASIADTLREEFANKGLRLYENIYIDIQIIITARKTITIIIMCNYNEHNIIFKIIKLQIDRHTA